MADVAHQGESGVLNEDKLGNDRESRAYSMNRVNWERKDD